ncbi:MAG: cytochrome c oxidase subunit II [Planctomycetota bacterium]|nr:cytochrome c oxidase subunit II [Planctomycetota bacterium]
MSPCVSFPFMPPDLSVHGAAIDMLIVWVHILMAVLFVGWGTFFVWTLVRFRHKRNPKADYGGVKSHASTYLEVAVAVIEGVLLVGLAIPLWADWVDELPDESEAEVVRIVAQQFAWNAHYPGPDGKFGRVSIDLVDETLNPLGLDPDDENGKDDLIAAQNQVAIPVNKPILVHLTSKDVIHSFGIPVLRVKQDIIPGMTIPVGFEATKTSQQFKEEEAQRRYPDKTTVKELADAVARKRAKAERQTLKKYAEEQEKSPAEVVQDVLGEAQQAAQRNGWTVVRALQDMLIPHLEIACAQLCGAQHYRMRAYLHILEEDEFSEWLDQWKQE